MKNVIFLFSTICVLCLTTFLFAKPAFANKNMLSKESLIVYDSKLDVDSLYKNVVNFIKEKKLTLFAEFDHEKNAKDVKLSLKPTKVLVFGSPLVGTKLMQQYPELGLVLPLKVLLIENKDGTTSIVYQNLTELFAPYGVKKDNEIVMKMQGLLKALATSSTK